MKLKLFSIEYCYSFRMKTQEDIEEEEDEEQHNENGEERNDKDW